jgi:hypothetical protein
MGEARRNILVKFEQQREMDHSFQGNEMPDTFNIKHFSESFVNDPLRLIRR